MQVVLLLSARLVWAVPRQQVVVWDFIRITISFVIFVAVMGRYQIFLSDDLLRKHFITRFCLLLIKGKEISFDSSRSFDHSVLLLRQH